MKPASLVRASQGLHPAQAMRLIGETLPRDTVYFCDIGNVTAWAIRCLRRDLPGTFFTDTVSGAMDYAIPAAIGGKLACPERPVCALVGDGGAMMGSVLDLFVAAQQCVPVIVAVFNDGGWGMVEHGVSQSPLRDQPRPTFRFASRVHFALIAQAVHASGVTIRTPGELVEALAQCASATQPVLLDILIDPDVTPPIGGRTAHVNRHMDGQ